MAAQAVPGGPPGPMRYIIINCIINIYIYIAILYIAYIYRIISRYAAALVYIAVWCGCVTLRRL